MLIGVNDKMLLKGLTEHMSHGKEFCLQAASGLNVTASAPAVISRLLACFEDFVLATPANKCKSQFLNIKTDRDTDDMYIQI